VDVALTIDHGYDEMYAYVKHSKECFAIESLKDAVYEVVMRLPAHVVRDTGLLPLHHEATANVAITRREFKARRFVEVVDKKVETRVKPVVTRPELVVPKPIRPAACVDVDELFRGDSPVQGYGGGEEETDKVVTFAPVDGTQTPVRGYEYQRCEPKHLEKAPVMVQSVVRSSSGKKKGSLFSGGLGVGDWWWAVTPCILVSIALPVVSVLRISWTYRLGILGGT